MKTEEKVGFLAALALLEVLLIGGSFGISYLAPFPLPFIGKNFVVQGFTLSLFLQLYQLGNLWRQWMKELDSHKLEG